MSSLKSLWLFFFLCVTLMCYKESLEKDEERNRNQFNSVASVQAIEKGNYMNHFFFPFIIKRINFSVSKSKVCGRNYLSTWKEYFVTEYER